MKKQVTTKLDEMVLTYSESAAAKIAVGLIPYGGSAVDTILSTRAQKLSDQRTKLLFKNIRQELSKLKNTSLNKKFLESDEFFDIQSRAFRAAIRTRHLEKCEVLAKILVGSMVIGHDESKDYEDYVSIIDELSVKEIRVLQALPEVKKMKKASSKMLDEELEYFRKVLPQMEEAEIQALLQRLAGKGLIRETVSNAKPLFLKEIYSFTPIFDGLIELLQRRPI